MTDATELEDAEFVRDSVIEKVRSGDGGICRSGAWAAERVEEPGNEIRVYRVDEVIPLDN